MSYDIDDTICAIGTAPGGAARGMVRISGRDAVGTVDRLFVTGDGTTLPAIRQPTVVAGAATLGESAPQLPCELFLWPTARSYTREPVAELHTVGSPPLLQALMAAVCRAGARLAEPGEFTLRAFLAGRLDLTRAEAVLGVIDAGNAGELATALAQLAGGLAQPLQQLRENLLQLLAELEAGLDFVEDGIEFVSRSEVLERLNVANEQLVRVADQLKTRRTSAEVNQVVLVGEPNVGKSSLFNAIARQCGSRSAGGMIANAALVSPQRGTTRDYLTASISLDGIDCVLVDTAGVEPETEGASKIESAAQELSADRRRRATVRVGCIEAADFQTSSAEVARRGGESRCDVIALTKSDLVRDATRIEHCGINEKSNDVAVIATSSRTGAGVLELCRAIRTRISHGAAPEPGGAITATAERCAESIRLAGSAVRAAAAITEARGGEELVASELRVALGELGKVVGTVYTDDLLDRIFRTFCIGK